jgi:hypothetical protein
MPSFARNGLRGLRRHWLIATLVLLAAVLRAIVLAAYRPALIFPDSERYLRFASRFATGHWTPDDIRPSGYSILITPAAGLHTVTLIPVAQHLLGLAAGVMVYALLTHRGSRRWLAALAAVPVLFDPLQLDLEQYVLSDVCAAFFVLAALVVLVWHGSRTGRVAPSVAGLLLAAAAVTRVADVVLIVPALLYLALVVRPWRRLAVRGGLLAGCFLLPVLGYAGWYASGHETFGLTGYNGTFLYGRVVDFADCTGLRLPAYERQLCPTQPPSQRNQDQLTWSPKSPAWQFQPPPGLSRQAVLLDFGERVLAHQPLAYLSAVSGDVVYGFSPVRGDGPERYPSAYLKFQPGFPPYAEVQTALREFGHTGPSVQPGLARFLTGYGRYCYVPGPVLAAALLVALAGLAGTRARGRGLRTANVAFTGSAVAVLVAAAAFAPFDWRYQLPQLTLIPVAAVLGIMALAARPAPEPGPAGRPALPEAGDRALR